MSERAHVDSALAHHRAGDVESAAHDYRAALALNPKNVTALHMLGVIERDAGHMKPAAKLLEESLGVDPNNAEAWLDYGLLYRKAREPGVAIEAFVKALAVDPDFGPAWFQRGQCHAEVCQPEAALMCFEKAEPLLPGQSVVVLERAQAEIHLGQADQAVARLRKLAGNEASLQALLADALWLAGDVSQAEQAFAKAADLAPDAVADKIRHAELLQASGKTEDALALLEQTRQRRPDRHDVAVRHAELLFTTGRFGEAWPLYQRRHERMGPNGRELDTQTPHWSGEPIDGKRLVLTMDQGLGEQIMFLAFVPELAARADIVAVELDAQLIPLARRTYPNINFVPWSKPTHPDVMSAAADFWAATGDFGRVLRPSADSFPASGSPLKPDPDLLVSWQRNVRAQAGGKFVIGLSHASPKSMSGPDKSVPLSHLSWLASVPDVAVVSLQYGEPAAQMKAWTAETGLDFIDTGESANVTDPENQAALMAATDLVISVSTTTAHLAGALHHPAWVLLPFGRHHFWYWMEVDGRSLWHPSVQRMRQSKPGDWSDLAPRLKEAVARKGFI